MVYPSSKPKGLMTVPQLTQRMLLSPVPSTRLAGHGVPHPGHCLSTKGSSPKAALFVTIVPDEVARESTRIDLMVIATASPTLAPSTATGRVTSCPPRNSGVIIGPQQPGGTTQRMCPPSLIDAAKPRLGPMSPPVYSSTKTSSLISLSIVCMGVVSFRYASGTQITNLWGDVAWQGPSWQRSYAMGTTQSEYDCSTVNNVP